MALPAKGTVRYIGRNKFEFVGPTENDWVQTHFSGAASVNFGFKLSSYTAELTVTTGGITVAKATGTTHSILKNYGATNYLKYGFGEDVTEAFANAALGPRVKADEIVKPEDMQWPANATHIGLIADTGSVTAYLGQGTMG